METEDHHVEERKDAENMETDENVTEKHPRPKQNADILPAKPHMPIKKEITEEIY